VNLGIVWGGYSEASGGGYTFSTEVLSALERAELPKGWQLTLLCVGDEPVPAHLKKWNLFRKDSYPLWQRICQRAGLVSRKSTDAGGRAGRLTFSGQALHRIVDVVVFTFPGYFEQCSVPQVSVIWDLSHRNVSLFPEISHAGQRETREKHFTLLTKNVDRIITGTERGIWEISHYYGYDPSNIWRIQHPTPSLGPLLREVKNDPARHRKTALYPAQFWAHKNHITLIKAWEKLAHTMKEPPRLVLVGKDYGNEAWARKKARECGIENLVEFRGFIPREELVALYKLADVLVYPSVFGPENLPPLEAMSMGCPVIVSNYPGAREQCGDAALYVEPLDSNGWAEAVKTVLTDQGLSSRLVELGKCRASSFTSDDFADSLLVKLKELCAVRGLWQTTEG